MEKNNIDKIKKRIKEYEDQQKKLRAAWLNIDIRLTVLKRKLNK